MNIKLKKDNKINSETLKNYIIDFLTFDGRFESDKEAIEYDLNFVENYYGINIEEVEIFSDFASGLVKITLNYDNGDVNYYECE